MSPAKPIPPGARRSLIAGAVVLVVIAAAVNIAHTRQNAIDQGQDVTSATVIGFLPDIGLVLSVTRLRYDRRSPWAWVGVAMSVGWVAWSSLAAIDGRVTLGKVLMALACLLWAIVYTGQAHVPNGEPIEDPEITMAHVEAFAEDAVRSANAAALTATQEAERAGAELANVRAERDRANAERDAARSAATEANARANAKPERKPRTRSNARSDQRERPDGDAEAADAFAAWLEREGTDDPMSNRELAGLLGKSVDAARTQANRWRSKAATSDVEATS